MGKIRGQKGMLGILKFLGLQEEKIECRKLRPNPR